MRCWLLALVSCVSSDPHVMVVTPDAHVPSTACLIENVLPRLVGTAPVMDCGSLGIGGEDAAFAAARDCVIAAESSRQPYMVLWQIQGIDSRVAKAHVGLNDNTTWTSYQLNYDGDPGGGGGDNRPVTTIWKCGAVSSQGACPDLHNTLCLECDSPVFFDRCPPR
ncbi:MAG: hypothetical protein H0T89_04235 [Deltaproteobacteria bacterium]|nr:hypothetical protein [Deltaproteobacteria bacterium]MDQ3296794.1 hypothetical protein [Myxococcota bacterium]